MTVRAVHWHEGMFLRPHHFQTAQRYGAHLANLSEKWDLHYNWGLRAVEIDVDALANFRLVVRSLQARLRDGTLINVPDDGILDAIDLKPPFEQQRSLTVYLGVPAASLGKANVSDNGTAEGVRYRVDTQPLEDENTGVNPQEIHVRLLNVKLLLSTEDHSGYEILEVARLGKADKAEATPELDLSYIPPVLACDGWKPLGTGILEQVYDRIGKKITLLADQVVSRGISFDSLAQGDPLIFAQLRELNEAYAVLGIVVFAQGVHPLGAYVELCRLVGQLAIFGEKRRPPELPRYDHDDLGGCFYAVKRYIDDLLSELREPEYEQRPFIGAGLRMQVTLEPKWLEPAYGMYVGVQSPLTAEECIRLLTKPGQLDMKIGSSDRVDLIYQHGHAGLRFAYSPRPPRALPTVPGLIYFEVSRASQPEEWQNVQRSLTLAIRLNENRVAGNIQGQQMLTIRTGGQTTMLEFTLYVVPQSSA